MNTPISPVSPFGDHTDVMQEITLAPNEGDFLTYSSPIIMPAAFPFRQYPVQMLTPEVSQFGPT